MLRCFAVNPFTRFATQAIILCFCAACGSSEAEEPPPIQPTFEEQLQTMLNDTVEQMGAPGATLAVAMPNEPVWIGATGMADKEAQLAMVPDDRFAIASITKTFTATVVLQLQEESKLTVNDTLETWYSGFPRGQSLTLHHLLSHTSGIVDYAYLPAVVADPAAEWEPEDLVALAAAEKPLFDPGADYSYSNSNFILLGLVVQAVTGNSWASEVRNRLLDPLKLADTFIASDEPLQQGDVAQGYFLNAVWTTEINPSTGWAAGGMISNAADLVLWLDALLYGDVLTAGSREAMKTPFTLKDGKKTSYGLGLKLKKTQHGKATKLGHGGDAIIYSSTMYHRTVEEITVVALVNGFPHEASTISALAWELALNR